MDGGTASGGIEIPGTSWSRHTALALWCLLLFSFCLYLDTRYNRFPSCYHAAEGGKARQILTGARNLHHPLLLLTASRLAAALPGVEWSIQGVAQAGRWASAVLASLAVVAFVLTAFLHGGGLSAFAAGAILAVCPPLLGHAHYLKEESALIFGLSAFFLALSVFRRNRSTAGLVLLGIGTALACGGKYVGFVTLPIAVLMVRASRRRSAAPAGQSPWMPFLVSLFLSLALINYSFFLQPSNLISGMAREAQHVIGEGRHPGRPVWSEIYVESVWMQTTWPVLVLSGVYLAFVVRSWRRRSGAERVIALFPVGCFALLSLVPLKIPRYILPVSVFLYLLAGMGTAELVRRVPGGRVARAAAAIACLTLPVMLGAYRCADYLDDFRNDSRARLEAWIRENLPKDAKIAQDHYVALPDPDARNQRGLNRTPLSQVIVTERFVVDLGTPEDLQANGFTYVATCALTYGRFLLEGQTFPSEEKEGLFRRRLERYKLLFQEGDLVWESRRSDPMKETWYSVTNHISANPVVRLYRLRAGPEPESPRGGLRRLDPSARDGDLGTAFHGESASSRVYALDAAPRVGRRATRGRRMS